ncbi:16258_t:CDS:10, partial [Acaulospora morrowiae]
MFSRKRQLAQVSEQYGQVKRHGPKYPHTLNFYTYPPLESITIDEFETFALDRLQVLKAIEGAILREKAEDQVAKHVDATIDKYIPLHSNEAVLGYDLPAERRKDHISHFILRLAYCRSEELRNWFLKYECILFRMRFLKEKSDIQQAFLADENLNWPLLAKAEKDSMKNELGPFSKTNFDDETFFEVDFEKVLDLVSRRAVYLKRGKAYVPSSEQVTLVLGEFRKKLEASLLLASKAFPNLDDERIMPLLNNINKQYFGKTFTGNSTVAGKVTAEDLVEHFPLCMQNLHKNLRANKHLRHYSRRQYNLFLKGIGLTLEEALVFWRKSFTKIDDAKFQKEYAYNIRHNYGMEGKRHDYAPLSCVSIIMNNHPGPGDNHGCPFRHFSEDNLRASLIDNGIRSADQINDIINLVRDKHYQVACTKYYEIARSIEKNSDDKKPMETISHPNQYFEASVKLAK